jgi:hypothetical protein
MTHLPLFPSQVEDIATLVAQPHYALHNAPGSGKTRVVVEAAAQMWRSGEIDAVVVVAPAQVRSVWASSDPTLGEIAKWAAATGVLVNLCEYHAKTPHLPQSDSSGALDYVISNPEFIRRTARLEPLLDWCRARNVLLVVEESWFIRTPRAAQTKAVWKLRKASKRVVFLNGTPGEPKHQFSTFQIMDPGILGVKNEFQFKHRFAQMGGFRGKEVVGYSPEQMAEFTRRTAPYVTIRTETPWSPDPIRSQIEVPLPPKAWALYEDMRKDAVARLGAHSSIAVTAAVVFLRMTQLTAGILGGLQKDLTDAEMRVAEVSPFKAAQIRDLIVMEQHKKVVVFCQFRAEIEQIWAVLGTLNSHEIVKIWGDQPKAERAHALSLFAPDGDPWPAVAIVHPSSGGAGVNLAQAHVAYFATQMSSSRARRQAEGRIFRPGQTQTPRFVDVLATGPSGQPTLDHAIAAALRRKEQIETWTVEEWRRAVEFSG